MTLADKTRNDTGAATVCPVGEVVETAKDARSGRLDGPLYRVVGVEGVLRAVRCIRAATCSLEGVERCFPAAELRRARREVVLPHAARTARMAVAQWQRAVDADDEDVDSLAVLADAAADLADLVLYDDPVEDQPVGVCGFVSDIDGAHVVQIDTTEETGRVRVYINDGTIYDGDPDTDPPPGAHYGEPEWDAEVDRCCDECGATTEALVSAEHGAACSLNPANVVPQVRRAALIAQWIDDVGLWGDFEDLPRVAWRAQVSSGETQLGYWAWVGERNAERALHPDDGDGPVVWASPIAQWIEEMGTWGDVEGFPRAEWRTQVADERTQLGYWSWVEKSVAIPEGRR